MVANFEIVLSNTLLSLCHNFFRQIVVRICQLVIMVEGNPWFAQAFCRQYYIALLCIPRYISIYLINVCDIVVSVSENVNKPCPDLIKSNAN